MSLKNSQVHQQGVKTIYIDMQDEIMVKIMWESLKERLDNAEHKKYRDLIEFERGMTGLRYGGNKYLDNDCIFYLNEKVGHCLRCLLSW